MLNKRDYIGAMTIVKFEKSTNKADTLTNEWHAYAAFHNGDYEIARKVIHVYLGLCSQTHPYVSGSMVIHFVHINHICNM